MNRRLTASWGLALALLAPPASADLKMKATPLLGADTIASDSGWVSFGVRLENTEKGPIKGTVVAAAEGRPQSSTSEAPVVLLPGATVVVRLPVRLWQTHSVKVSLLDEAQKELAVETLYVRGRGEPLLIDLHPTPRLSAAMKGLAVPIAFDERSAHGSSTAMTVGSVTFDTVSGDPILPERAAEWSAAAVVLAPSDLLARMGGAEQEALAGHVLAGGTLAVVVKRPEDLRQGPLPLMLGGACQDAGAARHLQRFSSPAPSDGSKGSGGLIQAQRAVSDALVMYSGGNLKPSDFGVSAPYGLGEVHLLAFDPTRAPEVDDPWVQSRVVELVRHSWDRRPFVVNPLGGGFNETSFTTRNLRKQLDPNHGARWAIVVASLLLVLYAILAGPINFMLASRAGKPLRALVVLPILSALTFLGVVTLAVASKGWSGQSRRVSLTEAAGGMTRGAIRRYRSFFTPVAQQVRVGASGPQALPSLIEEGGASLRLERGGVELQGVSVLPWQSVVVREDDIVPLGGGVSLTLDPAGGVRVTNRLGRDLRGALVWAPGNGLYLLASVRDGASALATDGLLLSRPAPSTVHIGPTSGGMDIHPLQRALFMRDLERNTEGLGAAWESLEDLSSGHHPDWWPEGQPVLLAQIDGGEGATSDLGLRIFKDRALLRVVGYGGAP